MEKYYVLEIAFDKSNYDKILNELYLNSITSILEENGIIKVYLPFQQLEQLETIKENLTSNNTVKNHSIYISPFDNKDWNNEWKNSIEPVYIKDRIIIYPSWKKDSILGKENKILIEIDPKMSFGTGHNETTQLILELMCDYINSNDETILDYGCGTGILSIAGVKLGLKKAVAIDIDPDAIVNAEENFRNNRVQDNVHLYKSDLKDILENDFDIICANISSGMIVENLFQISNKLHSGSRLFLTGILATEKPELTQAILDNGFKIIENREMNDWTSFYCIKN